MATTRVKGKVVFICNECQEDFDTQEEDFQDALDVLRNDSDGCRWASVWDSDAEEWINYCGDCNSRV